ncbi:MAG TPA: OB-fold nucleic acid binding domain-containing protein, partial [Candidatus Acidoferrum sp.]|nr:OB-fold nucleic acid binding domain-containing protein [Candidatus Acidoferrum sp.]
MEELIEKILAQRKDSTREQVQSLIEEKKRDFDGLLSDQGAARLVAEELLVETEPTTIPSMKIRDLVVGLNDVTLNGKVVSVEQSKDFVRQNGSSGRVVTIILEDDTGRLRCTIWENKVDEITKHGDIAGKLITIRHGYTRAGLTGELELNAGERSEITVTGKTDTPSPAPITTIGEIREPALELNLLGIIHSQPRIYEFSRNEQKGTVLRTTLADSTGSIPLVAWNERAEELRNAKKSDILRIQGGRLRRDNFGRLEVHLDNMAKVALLGEPPNGFAIPEIRIHKISELKPDLPVANFVARVVGTSDTQQVQRKTGESVNVSRLLVGDETGIVSVSLWDDKAALSSKLKVGDIIQIEDARPTLQLGQVSISAGRTTSIQKLKDESRRVDVKINKIAETGPKPGLVAIEGETVAEPELRNVTTGKGENIQVTTTRIRDDTGEARVSFWRSHAVEASQLRRGSRIRIYGLVPKPGLVGDTEFNTVQASKLQVLTRVETESPSEDEFRQFLTLKENEQAWVRAIVLDAGEDTTL